MSKQQRGGGVMISCLVGGIFIFQIIWAAIALVAIRKGKEGLFLLSFGINLICAGMIGVLCTY